MDLVGGNLLLVLLFLHLLTTRVHSQALFGKEKYYCNSQVNQSINQSSPKCEEVVSEIQEDINVPHALLLVLIQNPDQVFPNPLLVRMNRTGGREVIAGNTKTKLFYDSEQFSNMSSFLQLNQSTILITDTALRCIRSVDLRSKDASTFSGRCSREQPGKTIDSTIKESIYMGPNSLTIDPFDSRNVYVTDWDKIRLMYLDDDKVKTILPGGLSVLSNDPPFKYNEVLWNGNSFVVSSSQILYIFDRDWVSEDYILSLRTQFERIGFSLQYAEHFHIDTVSDELMLVSFLYSSQVRNQVSEKGLALVSLRQSRERRVIALLYPNPNIFKDGEGYPHAYKVSSGRLYFAEDCQYGSEGCRGIYYEEINDFCVQQYLTDSPFNQTELECTLSVTHSLESTDNSSAVADPKNTALISLSVTLPTAVLFSVLAVVLFVIHRRRSQSRQISWGNSDLNSDNVRISNRTLPATPATSEDTGAGYCTISDGLQGPEGLYDEPYNQVQEHQVSNSNVRHMHDRVVPAAQVDFDIDITYVLGDVGCVDHE